MLLRVPVFQRRYCWGEQQFKKFLEDAIRLSSPPHRMVDPRDAAASSRVAASTVAVLSGRGGHDFGRVVFSDLPNGHCSVLDGQQRASTVCILLSSIRDYCARAFPDETAKICAHIDGIVFPGGKPSEEEEGRGQGMEAMSGGEAGEVEGGVRRHLPPQCVLHVTYFDRALFARYVDTCSRGSPGSVEKTTCRAKDAADTSDTGDAEDCIVEARTFFDKYMNGRGKFWD